MKIYVYSKKYGFNKCLMDYLDIIIKAKVNLILNEVEKMDKKYLIDSNFVDSV